MTEAEREPKSQDPVASHQTPVDVPLTAGEPDTTPPPPPPLTRRERFRRSWLRWLLAALVVFSLGALAVVWLLYQPASARIAQTNQQLAGLQSDLAEADSRIADLEDRVQELRAFEAENQTLRDELHATQMHITLLSALEDVLTARLALAADDPGSGHSALGQTDQKLEQLKNMVATDQVGVVEDMQSRLSLAINEMERDTFASQSDLDILANNLKLLEEASFDAD